MSCENIRTHELKKLLMNSLLLINELESNNITNILNLSLTECLSIIDNDETIVLKSKKSFEITRFKLYNELYKFKNRIKFLYSSINIKLDIHTLLFMKEYEYLIFIQIIEEIISMTVGRNITLEFNDDLNILHCKITIQIIYDFSELINKANRTDIQIIVTESYIELIKKCETSEELFLHKSLLDINQINEIDLIDKNKKIILICDDSYMNIKLIIHRINKMLQLNIEVNNNSNWIKSKPIIIYVNDYVFILCCNGEYAYDIATIKKCHLIITDIQMPELDGLSMLERLYEDNNISNTVIMSALDEDSVKKTKDIMKNNVAFFQKGESEELLFNILSPFFTK